MYDETLAFTGLSTIMIGSIAVDLWWLAAASAALIGAGVLVSRLSRRTSTR
jgi:hypothetical protein